MPRITQEAKARNRERIVDAAGKLFRVKGIGAVAIVDLMKAAGLTHGGFYNHFDSKDSLAVEVCKASFASSLGRLEDGVTRDPAGPGAGLTEVADGYLSAEHRDAVDGGCPSASLVVDAWRSGVEVQQVYAEGVEGYLSGFSSALVADAAERGEQLSAECARGLATSLLVELIGAMTLARAVHGADAALSDQILSTTKEHLGLHKGSGGRRREPGTG